MMQHSTVRLVASAVISTFLLMFTSGQAFAVPTEQGENINVPERTSVSYQNLVTGEYRSTGNEHERRAGLSVVKIFMADYIMRNGDQADYDKALDMVRESNDHYADEFWKKYPDSIDATVRDYGLADTQSNAKGWGFSFTSTHDVTKFVAQLMTTNPSSPVLQAMREMTPIAADGYPQDFGTATLPQSLGSKLGWEDDRQRAHASTSFGAGFVITVHTHGTKETHTADTHDAAAGLNFNDSIEGFLPTDLPAELIEQYWPDLEWLSRPFPPEDSIPDVIPNLD